MISVFFIYTGNEWSEWDGSLKWSPKFDRDFGFA